VHGIGEFAEPEPERIEAMRKQIYIPAGLVAEARSFLKGVGHLHGYRYVTNLQRRYGAVDGSITFDYGPKRAQWAHFTEDSARKWRAHIVENEPGAALPTNTLAYAGIAPD
jgi:hypothetical protein